MAVGFGGPAGIDEARTMVETAPVVVGVPSYGPWLVGPVKILDTRGATGPDVAIALTCESGPKTVAKDPIGDGVCSTGASASVYPET